MIVCLETFSPFIWLAPNKKARPNPPFAENLLPLEWEYADDADFTDEDKKNLESMLPICKEILLEEWNLFVNESKTEFTHIYLAEKNEVDDKG